MDLKAGINELLAAVVSGGGEVAPHRLSANALAVLPYAGRLKLFNCERCRVDLVADFRRRFCATCANVRENKAQWRREKARRARR